MINKQSYNNSINQNIDMVRGDTLAFNFQLQGLGDTDPDAIIFSCADSYGATPIFTAQIGDGITKESYDANTDTATYSARIAPSKTVGQDLARYYYDMQITVGNDILTLMRGRLTLLNEVTL